MAKVADFGFYCQKQAIKRTRQCYRTPGYPRKHRDVWQMPCRDFILSEYEPRWQDAIEQFLRRTRKNDGDGSGSGEPMSAFRKPDEKRRVRRL